MKNFKMKTFDVAWKETHYQYGEDELENVRLGWELALKSVDELLTSLMEETKHE